MNPPSQQQKEAESELLEETWLLADLVKFFSVVTITMYFYTLGYVVEFGIPESPDLQKSTYFFISAFLSTTVQSIFSFIFEYNSIYYFYLTKIAIFCGVLVALLIFRKTRPATIRVLKTVRWAVAKGWFFVLLSLPILAIINLQWFYWRIWLWHYNVAAKTMTPVDPLFLSFMIGVFACLAIPIASHFFIQRKKLPFQSLIWFGTIAVSGICCFHLSRLGVRFMSFPVAISSTTQNERHPHLWFSERGRYVALCGDKTWRLEGITYGNEVFFVSDPRTLGWEPVCRYRTALGGNY